MPRVDWQMWFAALGDSRRERWFLAFCERLLQGSRPVLALLAPGPFADRPPRFLRARLYDYRFTDGDATGHGRMVGAEAHRPLLPGPHARGGAARDSRS